ncbi:hypothetical protein VKT23_016772 [Stygiomarasmius scandens]|uniref:Uncharacterized protein n=1 Tax=Marasmiellus scandens TaxID=2682957 RepID=A0ABR1IU31_9AGAR
MSSSHSRLGVFAQTLLLSRVVLAAPIPLVPSTNLTSLEPLPSTSSNIVKTALDNLDLQDASTKANAPPKVRLPPAKDIMSFVLSTEQAIQHGQTLESPIFASSFTDYDDEEDATPTASATLPAVATADGSQDPDDDETPFDFESFSDVDSVVPLLNLQNDIVTDKALSLPTESFHLGPGIVLSAPAPTQYPSSTPVFLSLFSSSTSSSLVSSPSSQPNFYSDSIEPLTPTKHHESMPTSLSDDPNLDPASYSNQKLIIFACIVVGLLVISAIVCILFNLKEVREGFVGAFTRSRGEAKLEPFLGLDQEKRGKLEIRRVGVDVPYPTVTMAPATKLASVSPSSSKTVCPGSPSSRPVPSWLKLPSQLAALHLGNRFSSLSQSQSQSGSRSSLSPLVPSSLRSLSPLSSFSFASSNSASSQIRVKNNTKNTKTSSTFASSSRGSPLTPQEIARLQNRVIDIVADFPRSRWSADSDNLPEYGDEQQQERKGETPLIPPEEFFALDDGEECDEGEQEKERKREEEEDRWSFSFSTYGLVSYGEEEERGHKRRSSAPVSVYSYRMFGRRKRVEGISVDLGRGEESARTSSESERSRKRRTRSIAC